MDRRRESLITVLLASRFEATLGLTLLAPDTAGRELRIRCQIPIARLKLIEMPRNTRTAASDAHYSGELRLERETRHCSHVSNLTLAR